MTVFEKDDVGGRLATVEIDGRMYESGGSIIHNSNKFMLNYLDICKLRKKKPMTSETFSVLAEDGIVFQVKKQASLINLYYYYSKETGFSLLDNLRLIWRYGPLQLMKLEKFYQNVLHHFVKIYDLLEAGEGYPTVEDLLAAMNPEFVKLTKTSLSDHLRINVGLDQQLIQDLVGVATKFNYGQFPWDIHSFVGAVSLIGFDKQLWAVQGGNYRIAECALKLSNSKMKRRKVKKVTKIDDIFRVDDDTEDVFDALIVASPLTKDKSELEFAGVDEDISAPGSYHRTIATIVQGELNLTAMGILPSDLKTSHYFHLSPTFPVWSVEKMTPVDFNDDDENDLKPVYRLFSHAPVDDNFLQTIFVKINDVSRTDWLAYPQYVAQQPLDKFQLSSGIFYINSIEMAASAMEMSVLGAKNVVNLIKQKYFIKNDPKFSTKTEL